MSTISVILPVYKVEKYIQRCVDSILGQTYTDFELILVDDGSPDNCGAICDEYAAKDNRVVVIHQENGGLSAARNAGIDWAFAYSDSQWLSFIDSDDWVHPEYLQRLLNTAEKNCADMSFCTLTAFMEDENGYQEIPFWGKPVACVRQGADILKEALSEKDGLLSGHHVIAWNKLYRKQLFQDLRYPVGQVHEDEAIAHRVLGCCGAVAATDDSLYYYRQHTNSIMSSHNSCYRSLCIALAYGDRMQYCHSKALGFSDAMFCQYWKTMIRHFYLFSKDAKCKKLKETANRQIRQLAQLCNLSNISRVKKVSIAVFCCMPYFISRLFDFSVKLRGG